MVNESPITLLTRRRIEAELVADLYASLVQRLGHEAALEAIGEAVEQAAERAGTEFAATAQTGPSMGHFATVLERWREGRALDIRDVRVSEDGLEFRVTRCAYVELYRSLGLSAELAYALSCRRDASFARGYYPGLVLERSVTLAEGSSECRFRFRWREE